MWTKKFWLDLAERALATFAGALLASFGVGSAIVPQVGWKQALAIAGVATLFSVAKALSARARGDSESASLVDLREPGAGVAAPPS